MTRWWVSAGLKNVLARSGVATPLRNDQSAAPQRLHLITFYWIAPTNRAPPPCVFIKPNLSVRSFYSSISSLKQDDIAVHAVASFWWLFNVLTKVASVWRLSSADLLLPKRRGINRFIFFSKCRFLQVGVTFWVEWLINRRTCQRQTNQHTHIEKEKEKERERERKVKKKSGLPPKQSVLLGLIGFYLVLLGCTGFY